jgi:tetratricopeptide (TPR) repeat protein
MRFGEKTFCLYPVFWARLPHYQSVCGLLLTAIDSAFYSSENVLPVMKSLLATWLTLSLCIVVHFVFVSRAQVIAGQRTERNRSSAHLQHVAQPPELAGEPAPSPTPLSAAYLRFVQSKAIASVDRNDAKTLTPAISELTELIRLEPTSSDFYLIRAQLSCYAHANAAQILSDVSRSISLHKSTSSVYPTLKDHYVLKAKVEFEDGHLEESMQDLDAAIRQDYEDAQDVFNDGNTEPTTTTERCIWTQADLGALEQRFPQDYRPPLYRGLYLSFFYRFHLEADYSVVLDAFHRAATLNPASALPEFYMGALYSTGALGGVISVKNAECLDWVVPRTSKCLALDEVHRSAIRSLTKAIALDPKFGPAYALRAIAFTNLKEYRQAVRDYDKVMELTPEPEAARIAYNDRGLAKVALAEYRSAIQDFTKSIAIGCKALCGSYENRADAYIKLHEYAKAIDDINAAIKQKLSSAVFLMNIDQFRRIYPEYDAAPDDVLCERLRSLFFPAMKYADFAKEFLIDAKSFNSPILPDLYLKRGDAYAAMKQSRKANAEYDRVSHGFTESAAYAFTEKNGRRIRKLE